MNLKEFSKSILPLVVASTCVLSCGKKPSSDDVPDVLKPTNEVKGTALTQDQIQKEWATKCLSSSEDAGPTWASHSNRAIRTLKMADGKFDLTVLSFDSDSCAEDKLQAVTMVSGTFALGAEIVAKFNNGFAVDQVRGSEINFTVTSFTAAAQTQDAVGWMNIGKGFCLKNDWALNELVELKEGDKCKAFADSTLRPFTTAAIYNSNLFFGSYYEEVDVGTSADKRPKKWAVGEEFFPQ